MAASDNMNGAQFWPIEKVGALRSGNRDGMTLEQEYQARDQPGDVRDYHDRRARAKGFADGDEYLDHLTSHIAMGGIKNPPTYRDDGEGDTAVSGAHRYFAARELGHKQMPVQPWAGGDRATSTPVAGWDY